MQSEDNMSHCNAFANDHLIGMEFRIRRVGLRDPPKAVADPDYLRSPKYVPPPVSIPTSSQFPDERKASPKREINRLSLLTGPMTKEVLRGTRSGIRKTPSEDTPTINDENIPHMLAPATEKELERLAGLFLEKEEDGESSVMSDMTTVDSAGNHQGGRINKYQRLFQSMTESELRQECAAHALNSNRLSRHSMIAILMDCVEQGWAKEFLSTLRCRDLLKECKNMGIPFSYCKTHTAERLAITLRYRKRLLAASYGLRSYQHDNSTDY